MSNLGKHPLDNAPYPWDPQPELNPGAHTNPPKRIKLANTSRPSFCAAQPTANQPMQDFPTDFGMLIPQQVSAPAQSSFGASPAQAQYSSTSLDGVPHTAASQDVADAFAHSHDSLRTQSWHGVPPDTEPNFEATYREIRAAADKYEAIIESEKVIRRLRPGGDISSEMLDATCYTIANYLIVLHDPAFGTTNRGKSDSTISLVNAKRERNWTFAQRLQYICEAIATSKKLLMDCVDRYKDVERIVVLAPVAALKTKGTTNKGNDYKTMQKQVLIDAAPGTTADQTGAQAPSTASCNSPVTHTGPTGLQGGKMPKVKTPSKRTLRKADPSPTQAASPITPVAEAPVFNTPEPDAGDEIDWDAIVADWGPLPIDGQIESNMDVAYEDDVMME